MLLAGLPAGAEPYEPPRPAPASGPGADRGDAAVVDFRLQVNDLRGELLDERERRIERWQEANGFVLVILGIAIGIGGLWAYAKFRSIADQASIGAAAARRYMAMPPDLLPGSGLPRGQPGNSSGPLPHLVAASPELTPAFALRGEAVTAAGRSPGGTADADAQAGSRPDADELQRHEVAIADCSETIRLDPRNPALYLERAEARSAAGRFEQALADYDRAIDLDPDHAAAYLGPGRRGRMIRTAENRPAWRLGMALVQSGGNHAIRRKPCSRVRTPAANPFAPLGAAPPSCKENSRERPLRKARLCKRGPFSGGRSRPGHLRNPLLRKQLT